MGEGQRLHKTVSTWHVVLAKQAAALLHCLLRLTFGVASESVLISLSLVLSVMLGIWIVGSTGDAWMKNGCYWDIKPCLVLFRSFVNFPVRLDLQAGSFQPFLFNPYNRMHSRT